MKPWLWLPPQLAHDLSPLALRALGAACGPKPARWRPVEWRGLRFPNPVGTAGGVDKNGTLARGWWALGAGFLEIGTVTPQPQGANPGPIMARDAARLALWNRMGFPSAGAERVARNLRRLPGARPTPVFVNVGKNRATPNELAGRDYAACIEALYPYADAFVINISSPNTKGLRDLLGPAYLREFLRQVVAARDLASAGDRARDQAAAPVPLLLKLSPDLGREGLEMAVEAALALGLEGFIATNTTLARESGSPFPNEGGVSGAPLAARSKTALLDLLSILGARRAGKLVVSAGGVLTAEDALERLAMGADLVQVYTALVFAGPRFFARLAREATRPPKSV